MPEIEVTKVIIPENRQRKEFDKKKLGELMESIEKYGLMHPIVLRERCDEDGDCSYELVAGERRFIAHIKLERETIPYTLIQDLSELEYKEAELEENIRRVDLTWQEKQNAYAELHELRKERNPGQTYKDTAREIKGDEAIGGTHMEVADAVLVKDMMDDPEVRNARNLRDAARIAKRKIRGEFAQALANIEDKEAVAATTPHKLIQVDILEDHSWEWAEKAGLAQHEFFQCIIADPPYGMAADKFGDAAKNAHTYQDDEEYARMIMEQILLRSYDLSTVDAHLYMFCDIDQFGWLKRTAKHWGWDPFRTPLIWPKGSAGHIPWGSEYWRRTYELVMFARKAGGGGRGLSKLAPDVFAGMAAPRERDHGAQKPVELYRQMISLSCLPGEKVLDPCCGSGTIFYAADETRTIAYGLERYQESYRLALQALQATIK